MRKILEEGACFLLWRESQLHAGRGKERKAVAAEIVGGASPAEIVGGASPAEERWLLLEGGCRNL